jgi:hypothetical protein
MRQRNLQIVRFVCARLGMRAIVRTLPLVVQAAALSF